MTAIPPIEIKASLKTLVIAMSVVLASCSTSLKSGVLDSNTNDSKVTITATAHNLTIQPTAVQATSDSSTQAFMINPEVGYRVSPAVGGSCPVGSWTGNVYQVAAGASSCNLIFEAYQVANTLSSTANFLSPLRTIPDPAPGGHVWYVDALNGNDSNSGLSIQTAFQSIGRSYLAWKNPLFNGGDVVVVLPGTYAENVRVCDNIKNTLDCSANPPTNFGGTASSPTIFMAMPCANGVLPGAANCARPKIIGGASAPEAGGAVFQLWAAYVRISGFEVTSTDSGSTAAGSLSACVFGTGGTMTDNGGNIRPIVHHLSVDNNVIHDCGAGGITMTSTDYVVIQNNSVYNNAFWAQNDTSGISVGGMIDLDNGSSYHAIVANNLASNNLVKVPINFVRYGVTQACPQTMPSCATDGNGIIFDTQVSYPNSKGASLVFGNVCFNNGGRGLSISGHSNIDVINNTFYGNGQANPWTYQQGQLSPEVQIGQLDGITPTNINIINNIIAPLYQNAALPSAIYNPTFSLVHQQPTITLYKTSNVKIFSNVMSVSNYAPGTSTPQFIDSSNRIADPKFVLPATNTSIANFSLQPTSPAWLSGLALPFDVVDMNWLSFRTPMSAAFNANNNILPNVGSYIQ